MSLRDDPRWSNAKTRAARLKWAREANGLSQDALMERAQLERRDKKGEVMGRGGYRRYEAENDDTDLPFEHAVVLAKKLGVRVEWLYHGHAPPFAEQTRSAERAPQLDEIEQLITEAPDELRDEMVAQLRFMVARRIGTGR